MGASYSNEVCSKVQCSNWRFVISLLMMYLAHCMMLGMDKSHEGCWRLLEATTLALDQKALQIMLTSAEEVNIALCVRYAVEE